MERRGATRYRLRLAVAYSWRDEAGAVQGSDGHSRDLNSRGIYVQSELIPPIGAYVEMNIFLPRRGHPRGPAELHSEGRVVRIESASSSSEVAGFAVMNHTVNLRDSQGRVLDGQNSWNEFGFDDPKARVIRLSSGIGNKPARAALLRTHLTMLFWAEKVVSAGILLRRRVFAV